MIGSAVEQNKAKKIHPVVHGNRFPMWIYDRRTLRFLEVSEGATRLYGYTREEFLDMTVNVIGPVEEFAKLAHLDPGSLNDSHTWTHRRKDGTPVAIAIDSNALIYEGKLARLVVAREVDAETMPEVSSGVTPGNMAGTDGAAPEPDIACRASEDMAYSEADTCPVCNTDRAQAALQAHEQAALSTEQASSADETAAWAADTPTVAIIGLMNDSYRMEQPLRRLLEARAEEVLCDAERNRHRVGVISLDLDSLDEVFEQFGSEGARDCVEQVGFALTRRLRGMDTVARTGTRSFTVILAELDDDFALHRVAQAVLKIFSGPVYVQGQPFGIGASIGIAVYPDDGLDFGGLCRAAEAAKQQAGANGGHRIAMFSAQVRQRAELDAHMREAMKRGGFRLYYQPQYSPGGEVRTLEALLRLPGKDAGFISPDLFIPIAEDSGMIEQLGMWVIEQASRQVKAWHREYGRLAHVAVNVSPLQLRGPGFAERALSVIRSHGVVPASLEFEITERAVLNFDEVSETMQKLSEAGIVFAVDDFGTGYSSLQHLHRLPISVLKIDRSFVQRIGIQRMGVPEGAEAIVEAIVSMAHSLGMRVVAEGVETTEQRSAATQMGCDSIQGFFHTPAVDASKIPGLMGWLN